MDKKVFKKLEANPNLISFVNRILNYNSIFENETIRSMFFVSLISSDCLIDKHACEETIEIADFILKNINLFILEDNILKLVIKYCKDAKKIAKRDIKNFN